MMKLNRCRAMAFIIHRSSSRRAAAGAFVAVTVVGLSAVARAGRAAETLAPAFRSILTADFKFTSADLAELERGRIVKRGLESTAPGEVAVVGAVRVASAKTRLVDAFRDIAAFKRGPDV